MSPSHTHSNIEVLSDVARVLADPVRLQLLAIIGAAREISCTQLVAQADVTASTVSYHIKMLTEEGLVSIIVDGRRRYVRYEPHHVRQFARSITAPGLFGGN
ncbi:helix-turn-helix transcriptional regulator [Rhodococcus sp. CX]|nr:helix-turn-helix transcriptional regulator [Rhodococcus sp. CX]